MRRRRAVVEVAEIPDGIDTYVAADWSHKPDGYARWLEVRRDWFAHQSTFPLDLCDGDHWIGTGTEMGQARDEWEAAHDRELPWPINVPDDPWDESMI